ncbi:endonuclease domain-containing protein [Leifsonia aquatica]|uniref:endonuclease domain-containing protein n=1 Tax=Leifsonia aquatica TaxID=144185 RepID=UPI000468BACE|nr:hypothetical protein [Leifsonia aquatica]
MRTPEPLPSALGGTSFTSEDARLAGVSASRLRARDLSHPFHGVHTFAPSDEVVALCRAYVGVMPDGAFFSHQTAAALLGIPLPPGVAQNPVRVAVAFPRTPPRRRGVIGHSLGSVEGTFVDGLPVSAPAHVWCQLSGMLDREDLVAAGDFLVGARLRAPVITLDDLAALSDELQRTKGARSRAWALRRIRFGADSRPETLLRLFLEERGIAEVQVNAPVTVDGGGLVLHADLSVPRLRLAFEYEGDGHRVDQRQWHLDIHRRELLEAEGWRVVRVTARDLFHDRPTFLSRLQRFVPNVDLARA